MSGRAGDAGCERGLVIGKKYTEWLQITSKKGKRYRGKKGEPYQSQG